MEVRFLRRNYKESRSENIQSRPENLPNAKYHTGTTFRDRRPKKPIV